MVSEIEMGEIMTRSSVVASLTVIKALSADPLDFTLDDLPELAPEPLTRTVLHLGYTKSARFGTVERMTEREYREFVQANTWPKPKE